MHVENINDSHKQTLAPSLPRFITGFNFQDD